jgi:hypothetical protein
MFFFLLSVVSVLSQVSVEYVDQSGFDIRFDLGRIRGKIFKWAATEFSNPLELKQIYNGVSELGCTGTITKKQAILQSSKVSVTCALEEGRSYLLQVLIIQGSDFEMLNLELGFSNSARRRLLSIPSSAPTTGAPTMSEIPSASPSRAPVSSAPTAPAGAHTISPSAAPSVSAVITSTKLPEANDGSKFAGFDLSSTGGLSIFITTVVTLVFVIIAVIGGPCLYRRFQQSTSHKVSSSSGKANLAKTTKGSSCMSDIEITAVKVIPADTQLFE